MRRLFPAVIPSLLVLAATVLVTIDAISQKTTPSPTIPVGVSTVDITPDRPIRLSGYGSRTEPSEGVVQKLHAKALAMGADGELSVLLTLDAIGIPAWVTEELAARLEERANLPREQLAVAVTHTHAAPGLRGNIPFMFVSGLTPEEEAEIERYTSAVLARLEEVAIEAIGRRSPARLSWTKGEVGFAVNRRVLTDGIWTGFGVQEDGPVDHSLPVLVVSDPDGVPRAILANYACHCTTLGGKFNQIHGDWAGVAREEIEKRHPEATALIAIGCGADQNPHPRGELDLAIAHGVAVADEVDRLLSGDTLRPIHRAPTGIVREIELALDPAPSRDAFQQWVDKKDRGWHFAEAMVAKLDRGEKLDRAVTYPVQTWTFGDDLAMIFLAGEVVVDYALRLYRQCDAERIWINAYSNDVPCYIPSRRMLAEGGYEVDYSMVYYGKPSRLSPETEDRIIEEVMRQVPGTYHRP